MRKIIIQTVIIVCLIPLTVSGATGYYYGAGKKINIIANPNVFAITWEKNVNNEIIENIVTNRIQAKSYLNLEPYKVTIIYSDNVGLDMMNKLMTCPEINFVYPLVGSTNNDSMILTSELIVKIKPSINISEIIGKYRLNLMEEDIHDATYKVFEVQKGSVLNALEIANDLTELGLVEYSCPNFIHKVSLHGTPNDQYFPNQWALTKISMPSAWDCQTGSPSVVVALFDGGIDLDHPDLQPAVVAGWDFYENDNTPECSRFDPHGTACAGIFAALTNNNTLGVAGMAGGWGLNGGCRIMPIRLYNEIDWVSDNVIKTSFEWAADHGAKIFSGSWGIEAEYSSPIHDGLQYAVNHGCLIFFSSGNDYAHNIRYPASDNLCKAVGATDLNDIYWGYSNWGPELDIVAPSGNIYTTDIVGQDGYSPGDYCFYFNGTSASCPYVVGYAALIWSANLNQTADEVWQKIVQSAKDLGDAGWDERYGWGRINYSPSEQPDNMVKNWWESSYIGNNIYNETGVGQYVLQFADQNQWAVYHVKIENDGDETSIFKLVASETGTGTWTSRYYDALSGGNDITTQIKSSSGWSITLDPGYYREIRVEVKPGSSMQGLIRRVVLTTTSFSPFATKTDVNIMDTQCGNLQPDNLIKKSSDINYIGNNIYNTNGQGQTKSTSVKRNKKATYHVKIENDGDTWNIVVINGTASDPQWDVKYFNALTGGTDVTASIMAGTYWINLNSPGAFAYMRMEVSSTPTTPDLAIKTAVLSSTAGYDANKKDVVFSITQCQWADTVLPKEIEEQTSATAPSYYFTQIFPNPIIDAVGVSIKYGIPYVNGVDLRVYDIKGEMVWEYCKSQQNPGTYTIKWDLKNTHQEQLNSGVYFCKVKIGNWIKISKFVIQR